MKKTGKIIGICCLIIMVWVGTSTAAQLVNVSFHGQLNDYAEDIEIYYSGFFTTTVNPSIVRQFDIAYYEIHIQDTLITSSTGRIFAYDLDTAISFNGTTWWADSSNLSHIYDDYTTGTYKDLNEVFINDFLPPPDVLLPDGQVSTPGREWYTDTAGKNYFPHSIKIDAIVAAPVPEPASLMLLGIGLIGLAGASRKRE